MSRCRPLLAALAASAFVVASVSGAAGDTREERDALRREQAAVAADLDVLAAADADITAALGTLEANLAVEQEALAAAEAQVEQAETRLAAARDAEQRLIDEIEGLEADVRAVAVQAYIGSGASDRLGIILGAEDPTEATQRVVMADTVTIDLNDLVDRLEVAREELEAVRRAAQVAADQASDAHAEIDARVDALELAREQHATLAAEVDARINARLAEAAALATLDAELSRQIQEREIALARATARSGTGAAPGGPVPTPPLRTVRGITVHVDIAGLLEDLLLAAEADGIDLGGGGYRDSADQWRLREAHCPDPVNSPPSECHPPTARPGTSNHERGLAVDFTTNGRVISSRSDPAFVWLAEHAATYGFVNLPSEPWHWSVDGS
jgi:flagellar biosynthesis chaperone FliJ